MKCESNWLYFKFKISHVSRADETNITNKLFLKIYIVAYILYTLLIHVVRCFSTHKKPVLATLSIFSTQNKSAIKKDIIIMDSKLYLYYLKAI